MAAIGASNVTYTVQGRSSSPQKEESGFKVANVRIAFGNGALTYPTGGIPLSGLSSWGFPHLIDSVVLADDANADGYVYKWDRTNNKLLMYHSAGFTPAGTNSAPAFTGSALANHTHDILLKNAAVADGATTRVNAGANLLGANTGADLTITGAGANGGVVNASAGTPAGTVAAPTFTGTAVSAAALVEVANTVAPAATVLYAVVRGY